MELRLALTLFAFIGLLSGAAARSAHFQWNDQDQAIRSNLDNAKALNRLADPAKVTQLLRDLCRESKGEISPAVPALFAELVHELRPLSADETRRIDGKVTSGELCPRDGSENKLVDLWSDALIMDSSEGSLKLSVEQIRSKAIGGARANYLLTMLAFARSPSRGAVRALIPLLEQEDSPRQALLGTSALIRNLIEADRAAADSQEVRDAIKAFVKIIRDNKDKAGKRQQTRAIVALKSLRNIGKLNEQAIATILEIATRKSDQTSQLRIVALAALRQAANHREVLSKVLDIYRDLNEEAEVRIYAYRVAIQDADRQTVQEIVKVLRRETSKQVGSYVSSHLENIQESSAPHHQQVREILAGENLPTNKFPKDIRKFSRNVELSYLWEKANLGGILEADLIYDGSFAPRSAMVNVSVPLVGKTINLLEVGVRQVGLEHELEGLFGPRGAFAKKNATAMFGEIVEFFQDEMTSSENEINRYQRVSRSRQASANKKALELSAWVNFDGKTIAYLDANDMDTEATNMRDVIAAIQERLSKVASGLKKDRSFAFMFLDTSYEIPAQNGNIKVDVNGTVVAGFKGDNGAFWPSIALELATKVGKDDKATKFVQTFSAAPAIQLHLESKDGRPVKVTFSLPKDEMNIVKLSSKVIKIENGREREVDATNRRENGCTAAFSKVLGVEICSKVQTPSPMFDTNTPYLPLNGPWNFEVTLKKTDRAMTGWEFALELPPQGAQEMRVYRAGFNTPGSRVDRDMNVELQLSTPRDGAKAARLRVKAPGGKTIDATASHKYDQSGLQTKADLTINRNDKYSFEAGLEKETKAKKAEWRPKLRIQVPNARPIVLGGSVTLDQGRKSQLAFDLHSNANQKQYFKGSFVKEGSLSPAENFRVSSDLQADIGVLTFRVFGMAERQEKALSTDMKVEYQRPNMRKHNVKVVAKLQNLSNALLKKHSSFLEVQMTQFPDKNFQVSWNVLAKPQEHLENELSLVWSGNMRDPTKKVQLLQVSKINGLKSGQRTVIAENSISLEIAPIAVNYEIKLGGHNEKGETPKFKIEFDFVDKNRPTKNAASASFDYQHISRKPLKLSMDAQLRLPSRELIYSDKLEEVAPNEYKGKTQFQWQQDKKATLDYTYRVKSDHQKTHHELDAELQTPSMKYPTHHQALLRMTPNDLEIKSKLNHERANLWDFQTLLSSTGKSNLNLDTSRFSSKLEVSPYEATRTGSFEFQGKTFPFNHQSNYQFANQDQLTVASKTIYKSKPILTINAHRAPRDSSRLNIDTQLFDARLDANHQAGNQKTASIEIRTKRTQGSHKTTISHDGVKVEIKSQTLVKGSPIAKVDAVIARQTKSSLNIDIPQLTGSFEVQPNRARRSAKLEITGKDVKYSHKSEIVAEQSGLVKLDSVTRKAGNEIANFQTQYDISKSFARLTTPRFHGNVEVELPVRGRNAGRFQLQDKQNAWEHSTDLSRDGSQWNLVSTTEKSGHALANLNGLYSPARSNLKIVSRQGDGLFELETGKSAKIELKPKSLPYYHKTVVTAQPNVLVISSKTDRDNRPLASLESRLSASERSTIRADWPAYTAKAEFEPATIKQAKFELTGKNNGFSHSTVARYQPRQKLEVLSSTEKSGRDLFHLDSQLSRGDNSHIRVRSFDFDGALEAQQPMNKLKVFKISGNKKNQAIAHETTVTFEAGKQLKVSSKTTKSMDNLLSLDSELSPVKAYLKVKAVPATATFDAADNGSQGKVLRVEVVHRPRNIRHESTLTYNKPQQTLLVVSTTKQATKNLLSLDTKLSRQGRSHLKVDRDQGELNAEADLFSRQKQIKIDGNCRVNNVQHKTEINFEPRVHFGLTSSARHAGREVYNLDGQLHRGQERSYLKVKSSPFDGSFDYQPTKSAKWTVQAKNQQVNHEGNLYWDREALNLDSKTVRQGKPLATLRSRVSRSDKSTFDLDIPMAAAKFEANPWAETKSAQWSLDGKRQNFRHEATIEFQPRRSLKFTTENKKDGRSILTIDSDLNKEARSTVTFKTVGKQGSFELSPRSRYQKAAKLNLRTEDYEHDSDIDIDTNERTFNLNAATKRQGRNVFDIKTRIARNADSDLKLKTIDWEVNAIAQPHQATRNVQLTIKGPKVNHETKYQWQPRANYRLDSKTSRNGRQVMDIVSTVEPKGKSTIQVTLEGGEARFETTPTGDIRSASWNLKSHKHDLTHETTVKVDSRQHRITLNSKIGQKGKVAKIDADLNRELSRLQVETPEHEGKFEVSPYKPVKTAKLSYNCNRNQYKHDLEGSLEVGKRLTFNSKSVKRGAAVAKVDLDFNRQKRSSFDISSDFVDAKGHFEPAAKAGNIEIRGKKLPISHDTNFAISRDQYKLKTRTMWDEQPLMNFETDLNRRNYHAKLDTTNKWFQGRLEVDPQVEKIEAEYKCARNPHRLMATAGRDLSKKQLFATMKWDADRDQEKKATIVATYKPISRSDRKARAEVKVTVGSRTEYNVITEMAPDALAGPHDITIEIQKPKEVAKTIRLHHQWTDGQVECSAKYLEAGSEKVAIVNSGRYTKTREGATIEAAVDVTSAYKYQDIDSFHGSVAHRHAARRDGFESSSQIKGKLGKRQVGAKAVTYLEKTRNGGKANLEVSAQTPIYDFKDQEAKLSANWDSEKVTLEANSRYQDKNIAAVATIAKVNREKLAATLDVTSQFRAIPSIKSAMKVDRKSVELTADVDNVRKVALTGNVNYRNYDDFQVDLESKSAWSPRYAATIRSKRSSDAAAYQLLVKEDTKEILAVLFNGQKSSRLVWQATGSVAAFGKERLQGNINLRGLEDFEASVRGARFEPVRVTYRLIKNGDNEFKPLLKVCQSSRRSERCATLEATIRKDDQSVVIEARIPNQEARLEVILAPKQGQLSKLHLQAKGKRNANYDFETNAANVQNILSLMSNGSDSLAKYNKLSDKVYALRSELMSKEWLQPFRTEAALIGGQHFVTFDKSFYDFAGQDCAYTLAQDLNDGNFTVVAKFNGLDQDGRVKKTIQVRLNDQVVEISPESQSVRLNGKETELPLRLGKLATVTRRANSILVDDKHGLQVECLTAHDICTVSLTGWYFGKTGGLMGSYDYEPSNDMRLANSKTLARSVDELAKSWEAHHGAGNQCRHRLNLARNQEISANTAQYDKCQQLFTSERSPLRSGFAIVPPVEYLSLCLRHQEVARQWRSASPDENVTKALATVVAAYVKAVRNAGLFMGMPAQFLACQSGQGQEQEFGSRTRHLVATNSKKADIVFVVEEAECNRELIKELGSLSRSIEADLGAEKTSAKFALIGFGGPSQDGLPHSHTARGRSLFDRKDIALATERIELAARGQRKQPSDAFEALAFAAETNFRTGASKNLVLLSCTPCKQSRLGYSDMHRMLQTEGIALHVVNDRAIEVKSAMAKQKGLFAVDRQSVYRGKDFMLQDILEGQPELRVQVTLPKDICVTLSQENRRGSFFTTSHLNEASDDVDVAKVNKTWKSLFSKRLVASAQPIKCQHCECVLDTEDELHAKQVCRPCKNANTVAFLENFRYN